MSLRKAAEMALEALDGGAFGGYRDMVVETLRQALAQPEREPVAGTKTWFEDGNVVTQNLYASDIYTAPPKREWVGLTDEEIDAWGPLIQPVVRAIEAKLKEKNT